MSRKPVLVGGKREEILEAALLLFLDKGYEGTSIRMILHQVDGEVGMFYHYFSSKQELFDISLKHFMEKQKDIFLHIAIDQMEVSKSIDVILEVYQQGMTQFYQLTNGKVHWTILYSLHAITVDAITPMIEALIYKVEAMKKKKDSIEMDVLIPFILKGISGLLHDTKFNQLEKEQQRKYILEMLSRVLSISLERFTK